MKRLFEMTNMIGYTLAYTAVEGRLKRDYGPHAVFIDKIDLTMTVQAHERVLEAADGIWHGTFHYREVVLYAWTYDLVNRAGLICYANDLPARTTCLSHYASKRPLVLR